MNPSNSRARLCFEFLEHRVAPVVGLDPSVSVDDSSVWVGPPQLQPILAPGYEPSPVKPMADLNGDGDDDILTVDGSRLTVVSGADGSVLIDGFAPYEESFTGEITAVIVDLGGDGRAEVVTAPKSGGAARVQVFGYEGGELVQRDNFFAFADDPNYSGGASISVGDVNGDLWHDLVVGAGPGGGPRVAVFDGRGLLDGGADPIRLVGDFFAFDPGFHGGVSVMAFNPYLPYLWEGVSASLMIGAGLGGAPQVLTLDGRELMQNPTAELADPQNYRFIGDPNARDGVEFRSSTTLNRAMSYRAGGLPDDEGWIITGIQVA